MIEVTIKSPYNCKIYLDQNTKNTLSVIAPSNMFNEFRAMVGYRWDKENKKIIISDCPRNLTQIKILKGENPFEHLDKPLEEILARRAEILPQQQLMLNHAVARRSCLIAGDMGVGKSLGGIEL